MANPQVRRSMCLNMGKEKHVFLDEWCRNTKNYTDIIAELVFAYMNGENVTCVTMRSPAQKAENSLETQGNFDFDEDLFDQMFG